MAKARGFLTFLLVIQMLMPAQKAEAMTTPDQALGSFLKDKQKDLFKDFVLRASHTKDLSTLIERSHFINIRNSKELKRLAAGVKMPKMIRVGSRITIFVNGKEIHIEPAKEIYSFRINDQEFMMDPSWSVADIYQHLAGARGSTHESALLHLLLPKADAILWEMATAGALIVALVMYEASATVIGPALGCAVGIRDSGPKVSATDACLMGAKDGYAFMAGAPLIAVASALGPLYDKIQDVNYYVGEGTIECQKDGSFTLNATQKAGVPVFKYSAATDQITIAPDRPDAKTYLSGDIDNYLKTFTDDRKIPRLMRKLAHLSIAIRKDISQMKEDCIANPETVYRFTKTRLERATRDLQNYPSAEKAHVTP